MSPSSSRAAPGCGPTGWTRACSPPDLAALAESEAVIVNIDYPLGAAAYLILSYIATRVGEMRGVYAIGKAATLNGVIGDVMIPGVVHDEHSQNTYLFSNCFAASDISDDLVYGTVLDNQKTVSVRGTFLQTPRYMDVFYREGYTDIEMEAGPYLSAVSEMYRPRRHPNNEIVNLHGGCRFDIGLLHYASDTPLSKGRNLGSGSLSYFGMDPTYATSLAIVRRILRARGPAPARRGGLRRGIRRTAHAFRWNGADADRCPGQGHGRRPLSGRPATAGRSGDDEDPVRRPPARHRAPHRHRGRRGAPGRAGGLHRPRRSRQRVRLDPARSTGAVRTRLGQAVRRPRALRRRPGGAGGGRDGGHRRRGRAAASPSITKTCRWSPMRWTARPGRCAAAPSGARHERLRPLPHPQGRGRGRAGPRRRWSIEHEYRTPAQEHAFLQPEAGLAYIDEQGRVTVEVAGQWTHEDQEQIAHALGCPSTRCG